MTKAEEAIFNIVVIKEPDFTIESLRKQKETSNQLFSAMSTHAQEFAEWCSKEGWIIDETMWGNENTIDDKYGYTEMKTTSELYTTFNNQNK
jgi:hypothetical protein